MISKMFRIDIDLYGTYVIASFNMNRKVLSANIKRRYGFDVKVGKIYAGMSQVVEPQKHTAFMLIAFNTPFQMTTHGTIAHEALHATNRILYHVGVDPDHNNDEAQAYLLSYIVDEIYKQGDKNE